MNFPFPKVAVGQGWIGSIGWDETGHWPEHFHWVRAVRGDNSGWLGLEFVVFEGT